jgi:hypothetical protein
MWQLDHLSRWLEREGLVPDELAPERAEQFLAARSGAGYVTWATTQSMTVPLAYLREVGSCRRRRGRRRRARLGSRLLSIAITLRGSAGWPAARSTSTSASHGCSWRSTGAPAGLISSG